jgi:S1-C subfamily serine protease
VTFYINWFDLVIALFLTSVIWRGIIDGFVTQFLVYACFFGSLFLGGWLFPHLLPIHNQTTLTIVNANLVLIFAILLAFVGFEFGRYLHYSFLSKRLHWLETGLSIVLSFAAGLVAVWLIGSMIGRLPFEGFSNSANDALIVQALDQHLPPVPAVFAEFNHQLNPNNSPQIFTHTKFQTQQLLPATSPMVRQAAAMAERSVVRVTSFGCGGLVSGSGFVVAPNLIITSAHVVAGVHRPIVKYGSRSYAATPVLFDADLDLAALRVTDLKATPLNFINKDINDSTQVIILGYPGGNYTVAPGLILDEVWLSGTNIYGIDSIDRLIYEVQVSLQSGNSGGPMILPNGQVAGIIFGKATQTDQNSYGLALPSTEILDEVQQAQTSTRPISAGACLTD